MAALKIVALALGAAVLYGVLHDPVTARVCFEYFTIAHPRGMDSTSPTHWGVVATWWLALAAGRAGYAAARAGQARLLPPLAGRVPPERHAAFIADLWAHLASYAAAALGTLVLRVHTSWRRFRTENA